MISFIILTNCILNDIATCMSISVIMFAPYCYKQLVVKCDYVLKQVQTLSLLKFT